MTSKKIPYIVYAESTPNPSTMKFVVNKWLVGEDETYEILPQDRMGSVSPLADALYKFPFINGVFISGNFITITKSEQIDWNDVVLELREFIVNYLSDGGVVIDKSKVKEAEKTDNVKTDEQLEEIKPEALTDFDKKIISILDEYIKPAVESDGGAIEFHSYKDGVVKVILKGSCSGCPSSTMTLKAGIEGLLTNMLPEVKEVVAING